MTFEFIKIINKLIIDCIDSDLDQLRLGREITEKAVIKRANFHMQPVTKAI